MPDRTPPQPPGFLSRLAAKAMLTLEKKAQPALAYRHSVRGGGSGGPWWGDGSCGGFLTGALPGDDRDVVADAGDLWLNSAVASCLSWLMDQFGEPFLQVTALDRATGDYKPYAEHELINLLENVNPGYDADSLWAATVLSYQLSGNAYWIKARAKSGKVLELWHASPWEVEPAWPDDGSEFISGYIQRIDGVAYSLPREDVVHFRCGMDPANPRVGLSPLGAVLREVATDNAAGAYEAAILRNMGVVPLLVQPAEPGDEWDDGNQRIIKDQFQSGTTGSNRGRVVVPSARVDVKQFGLSPKDMTVGSIRFIPEDRICAATGVNAMVVGLSSGSLHKTYNNLGEATRSAYNRGLIPMQRRFARAITAQLLYADFKGRPGVDYCEWDYGDVAALSEDATDRVTRAVAAFEKRLIKRGEACEIAGMNPPDPEFDVYLEQPSVENARAWAAVDDNPDTDPNASARLFGKPNDKPPSRLAPGGADDAPAAPAAGQDDAADDEPAPRLRIAKALAGFHDAVNGYRDAHAVHTNGAASRPAAGEREDGIDPFSRLAGQVASLASTKAADPIPDPWAEDDEEAAPDEANTYGLPTGRPIAEKLREFLTDQLREMLGTVRTIGADLGDPAAWTALPPITLGLGDYDRPMAEAMTPIIGVYWDESGKRVMAKLGLDPDDWRVVDPNTRRMIEGAAFAFAKSTNETTTKELRAALDTLRRELAEGIVDRGEALPKLTKRVQSVFENASKNRAKTIAETEASRAVHAAQIESAKQSGVIYSKRLLLSSDACEICHAVKASEPENGWPLADAMYDDGKGHPEYSVAPAPPLHPRCRCAILLISYEEAGVARPDFGSVFDDVASAPADDPDPGGSILASIPADLRPEKLGKMEINPELRNRELDNFLRANPDARIEDIPITREMQDKAEQHLRLWRRTQPGEVAKVRSILSADELPAPIIRFYDAETVGFPDGFHRVTAYILARRTTIRGYAVGDVPAPALAAPVRVIVDEG